MGKGISDNNLLNVLLRNISDGIFIADKEFNTIAYSEFYRKILGATEEEMNTKKITDFYDEGLLSCIPIADIIKHKEPCSQLIKYYRTCKEILCTGVPVMKHGEIQYVILSFRDLSKLKETERELRSSKDLLMKYEEQLAFVQSQYASIKGENLHGLIYRSQVIRQLLQQIQHIAQYGSNILIIGQTGTGKGQFAKLIHKFNRRYAKGEFVKVDCTNIPENLLESELFGYSQGAFTGANTKGKIGLVEMANGGTLFLDEIGELPLQFQSKILNMIEDRKIRRVGEGEYRNIDLQIVSATNRNLDSAIRLGTFRKDLYYRLNTLVFEIPALTDRREDIVPLANYYLKQFSVKYGMKTTFSIEAYQMLLRHDWPGNIRELIHTIERIVLMGEEATLKELGIKVDSSQLLKEDQELIHLDVFIAGIEKEYISRALNGSKSVRDCAEKLGIDTSTLVRKMKRHNLSKPRIPHKNAH